MQMIKLLFISLLIHISLFSQTKFSITDRLVIYNTNPSREFFFTNKISSFYYGETNEKNKIGWQGFTFNNERIFYDHSLLIDNKELDRSKSVAKIYPYKIERVFSNITSELIFLPDSINGIYFRYDNLPRGEITFQLYLDSVTILDKNDFSIQFHTKNLQCTLLSDSKIFSSFWEQGSLHLELAYKSRINVFFNIGKVNLPISKLDSLIEQKKNRIESLFNRICFSSNIEELDKAFYWNVASLDALVTNQGMKGIFAGLPWFNDYWGRDTFISLPGATFLLGNFDDAKEILLSFMSKQDTSENSLTYGRIPNRITLNEIIYNTADGTPWFVIQAYNLIKITGDIEFAKKIYPSIKLATEATLKKYCDKNYFLTHGDAETWMDAVGGNGPWSPRGNRANDVQILWYKQLVATSKIAKILGDKNFSTVCEKISQKLLHNIKIFFVDTNSFRIFDHIKFNDVKDTSWRPNLLFLLIEDSLWHSNILRFNILKNVLSKLVFPYGILSLSYEDENFHPFHQYQPFYEKDAAYHNGIIWIWNFGPVITALNKSSRVDLSFILTKELINQTLYRGCVGGLSELSDAFPKNSNKEVMLSGTFVQAWSMSEFIRTILTDYMGVNVNALDNKIELSPKLPDKIKRTQLRVFYKNYSYFISYKKSKTQLIINIDGKDAIENVNFCISYPINQNKLVSINFKLQPRLKARIIFNSLEDKVLLYINNKKQKKINLKIEDKSIENELSKEFNFAEPVFNPNWKSIQHPEYDLLNNNSIKFGWNRSELIIRANLLINDSCKNKNIYDFQYPLNPNFKFGITSLELFQIYECDSVYFFRMKFKKLINPNWHPEYGYQLTYSAIAIRNELGELHNEVGRNSNMILNNERSFSRIIYIGGGVDVCDSRLNLIARYVPSPKDVVNPLGNTDSNEINFTLHKKLLGRINNSTKITIIVGLQDDHGGSGIGEFRSIDKNPSEWIGGGKNKIDEPNVYEIIFIN